MVSENELIFARIKEYVICCIIIITDLLIAERH